MEMEICSTTTNHYSHIAVEVTLQSVNRPVVFRMQKYHPTAQFYCVVKNIFSKKMITVVNISVSVIYKLKKIISFMRFFHSLVRILTFLSPKIATKITRHPNHPRTVTANSAYSTGSPLLFSITPRS